MHRLLARGKELALTAAAGVAGPRLFASMASRLGREPTFDLDTTRDRQREIFPESSIVSQAKFVTRLLDVHYSAGDPNLLIPDASVPSVYSFVPYYRGITTLVVFNFFQSNYGVRGPVLYRFSVLDGRMVVWCKQLILSADAVVRISDPSVNIENLPERGNILLEAFHPRITTPGRQLRYFVIYREEKSGSVAGVHSMVFAPEGLIPLAEPSYRAFGVGGVQHYYHSPTRSRSPLAVPALPERIGKLTSSARVAIPGYMTAESPTGAPVAIWHDGPTPHFVGPAREKRHFGTSYTGFFVPDFSCHAPLMHVSASQIGFSPKRLVAHVIGSDGSRLASEAVELPEDHSTVDLGHLFSSHGIGGAVSIVVEFDRDIGDFSSMPVCYLHLYYRSSGGWSDQVHSHNTLGYAEDPFRSARPYRCRKFAPFLADSSLDFYYSIVNVGPGLQPVHDASIRVRVFTDTGEEHVWLEYLSPSGITNLRARDILHSLPVRIREAAVVQFEHDSTNFNGAWYAWDRSSGHLAVDHLTGG